MFKLQTNSQSKFKNRTGPWLVSLIVGTSLLFSLPTASAGDVASLVKKVGLPAESKETAARLAAADRLVKPDPLPEEVGALIGGVWESAAGQFPGAGLGYLLLQASRQKWPEALEEYQRIIYDEGDNLVQVNNDSILAKATLRSVLARTLCHQRIAEAPPWVLARYRQRINNLAESLFREGQEKQDVRAWARLVNDHFCSRQAEKALELFGDRAFEQGDFSRARQWWGHLANLPSQSNRSLGLLYPASEANQARAQAKQIIALAFQGDLDTARKELSHFKKRRGKSAGTLAGKKGLLAAIIDEILLRLSDDRALLEEHWHSFACDGRRNSRVPFAPQPRLWADGPTWRVFLATGKRADSPDGTSERAVPQPARRLCFHPIIAGDRVLVAGARSVTAYHLLSGEKLFRYHLKEAGHDDGLDDSAETLPADSDRSYTLTVAGDRIYVRLGGLRLAPGKDTKKETSYLVCLEMKPAAPKKGPAVEVRELWTVPARGENGEPAVFEGSPIVAGNRVYLAMSRVQGRQTLTSLACYDATSGSSRWTQEVCHSGEFEESSKPRFRHHLVTLAGRYLAYCSHAGAIVAVDTDAGTPAWALRYRSLGPERTDGLASSRELCPCVHGGGRLFVAPMDSDRILCLDPASGELLWERDGIEVVHLLAVAGERLFFTTPTGLRAVQASSGVDQGGWSQPAEGKLPPFGRGFLAGGWIFWPTQDPRFPLRVLTQDEGDQEQVERPGEPAMVFDPTQLHRLRAGNMVYANGCLVVAGTEELVAYVAPSRLLHKVQDKTGRLTSKSWRPQPIMPRAEILKLARPISNLPDLVPPLTLAWKQPADLILHPERGSMANTKVDMFLLGRGDRIFCCDPATGKARWQRQITFRPRWAGLHVDRVVIAGERDIESLQLEDGRLIWAFRAEPEQGAFESFQLTAEQLLFVVDSRRLVALDLDRGSVRWSRWAPGGRLLPLDAGRFVPHFLASDGMVIIQCIRGQTLCLDAVTGRLVRQGEPGATLWPHPPLPLEPGRACVVENGHVRFIELSSGREIWKFEPRWPTSSSGEALSVLGDKKTLLAVVPRNYGYEIERLDPASGRPVWEDEPRLVGRRRADLQGLSAGEDVLYQVGHNSLACRSLHTGKVLWKKKLPRAGAWQTRPTPTGVITFPAVEARSWLWLSPGTFLLALPAAQPFATTGGIVLLDRNDGRTRQQLDLPLACSQQLVEVFSSSLVVVSAGTAWGWKQE